MEVCTLSFGEAAGVSGTSVHFSYIIRPYNTVDSNLQGIICLDNVCPSSLYMGNKLVSFTSDKFQASAAM